jgi:hypothetical protein
MNDQLLAVRDGLSVRDETLLRQSAFVVYARD